MKDQEIIDYLYRELNKFSKKIRQEVKEDRYALIRSEINDIKSELKQTAEAIFFNMDFIKKFKDDLHRFIEQEIRTQLSEKGLQKLLHSIVVDVTTTIFKEIIAEVVEQVITKTRKRLEYEYRITKELCYSIDSEIKHTLTKLPISYTSEENIKEKMIKHIEKLTRLEIEKLTRLEIEKSKLLLK